MNIKPKSKSSNAIALRAVVGGLLASPLSGSELKNFAHNLDLEFLSDLRELLLSLNFPSSDKSEATLPPFSPDEDIGEVILSHSKGRRLSKNQVYAYMHEIDNSLAKSVIRPGNTLRESVQQFVRSSGPEMATRLLGRVQGTVEQDPYLAGISKNK